ncbi:hypothetical protein [uncultured Paraglaciecola sp.]|uniref:hypothetical protein n=1 Tax=uncultured Paraglaciecola sp. TaxID=1765024 RepID=UPI00260AD925|nr:hypothetical protein [uncultured Paraglaciecola sp.]
MADPTTPNERFQQALLDNFMLQAREVITEASGDTRFNILASEQRVLRALTLQIDRLDAIEKRMAEIAALPPPDPVLVPVPVPAPVVSPDGMEISDIDTALHTLSGAEWSISAGRQVQIAGVPMTNTKHVERLVYKDSTIYHYASGPYYGWYRWDEAPPRWTKSLDPLAASRVKVGGELSIAMN